VQQNPLSALNPRRRIGASIRLALDVHGVGAPAERDARIGCAARRSRARPRDGPSPAVEPFRLASGSVWPSPAPIACDSRVLVLDEPTSALDVLVQGRVLRLLNELRTRRGLTYVFITHDLSVVRNIATRVAVFEKGRLVELAETTALFARPSHPYTRGLLAAVPVVTAGEQTLRDQLTHG